MQSKIRTGRARSGKQVSVHATRESGNSVYRWPGCFPYAWAGGLWTLLEFSARLRVSYIPVDLFSRRGWARLLPQCYTIGTRSVPVVMLTGMFVGMVLIVQGWEQFATAGLSDRLGAIVNILRGGRIGPGPWPESCWPVVWAGP